MDETVDMTLLNPRTAEDWHRAADDRPCKRNVPIVIRSLDHPERWFWGTCRTYLCDDCGPQKAREVAAAVGWAADQHPRSRFVTLSQAPLDWQQRRQKMRDLARWARGQGYGWNVAWTTERGSKTGMVHIHAVQWGTYIPQPLLVKRWGHWCFIEEVKGSAHSVGTYMAKGAAPVARYMVKGAGAGYAAWRDLNGGRPIHVSRGFLPGSLDDAIRAARQQQRSDERWERVTLMDLLRGNA